MHWNKFKGIVCLFMGNLVIQCGISDPDRPMFPFVYGIIMMLVGATMFSIKEKELDRTREATED